MTAHNKQKQLESCQSHVLVRRERLRQLLARDNEQYEAELRSMPIQERSSSQRPTIEELREAKERMRRERMEQQEKAANEKMLQHWKLNNPDFREVGSEIKSSVIDAFRLENALSFCFSSK